MRLDIRMHDPTPFFDCTTLSLALHIQVDTMGVSGERVIDSMKNRLDTVLSKQSYNWIIILGGEVHTCSHAFNKVFPV